MGKVVSVCAGHLRVCVYEGLCVCACVCTV